MIYAVGCYLGEVLVRHSGGEWCATDATKMRLFASVCSFGG